METTAVAIRYLLVAVGAYLVGRGKTDQASWTAFMQGWDAVVGGLLAIAPIVWGFYTNWNTKRVSAREAETKRLTTISPFTGQAQPQPPKGR